MAIVFPEPPAGMLYGIAARRECNRSGMKQWPSDALRGRYRYDEGHGMRPSPDRRAYGTLSPRLQGVCTTALQKRSGHQTPQIVLAPSHYRRAPMPLLKSER